MILAIAAWSWGWLTIAAAFAGLETVAMVKNKNGTLSRNLRRVTGGDRKWPAIVVWVAFAVWFPLHLWVFLPGR